MSMNSSVADSTVKMPRKNSNIYDSPEQVISSSKISEKESGTRKNIKAVNLNFTSN